jgi:E2F/DP family winged-helix DNA-binding domain
MWRIGPHVCAIVLLSHQQRYTALELGGSAPSGHPLQMLLYVQTRKRRIYDVTNVLEGVGLLRKTNTSKVQWSCPEEIVSLGNSRYKAIHQERLERLRDLRERMQHTMERLTSSLEALTSDEANCEHLYVCQRDIAHIDGFDGYDTADDSTPPVGDSKIAVCSHTRPVHWDPIASLMVRSATHQWTSSRMIDASAGSSG